MNILEDCRKLTNDELFEAADKLATSGRVLSRELLGHLAVMDERGACTGRGYPNIYTYCVQRLRFSESEAYNRVHIARAARHFHEILDLLESGQLNMTTACLLTPYLTDANRAELFAMAAGKSRREVERLVAALAPRTEKKDVLSRYPARMATAEWPASPALPALAGPAAYPALVGPVEQTPPGPVFSFDKIEAVDGERYRLHFDVGPETAKLLDRAKEILRHKFPFATFEDIVKEALTLLLAERDPEIKLKLEKESAKEFLTGGRRIPFWVRRKVWKRDHGRCAFVAKDGRRCDQRSWLEYDHIVPYSKGGRSDDPANIRLLCRAHNQHEAERVFGPAPPPETS